MMIKKTLAFLLIVLTFQVNGQEKEKPSRKIRKSAPALATFLTKGKTTEAEKVHAIYSWVTSNIAYDYDKINSNKPFELLAVDETLKSKKAICSGYARLMVSMLEEVQITAELVDGYTPRPKYDTVAAPSFENHAWVAVNVSGEWKFMDPTYDAGYIGNTPTNKKEVFLKKRNKLAAKYTAKEEKLKLKKSATAEAKAIESIEKKEVQLGEKRTKKEDELTKKENNTDAYTNEIGFIRDVKEDWFLIDNDSFLIDHLPANPMWQLREDTLGIACFVKGVDTIKTFLDTKKDGSFSYKKNIDEYMALDFLNKYIYNGDSSHYYNPHNFLTKALNYYNFLEILHLKEVENKIDELPIALSNELYESMLFKLDTVKVYVALAKNKEGERNKLIKAKNLSLYQSDTKTSKSELKQLAMGNSLNDRTLKKFDTESSRMKKEIKKLSDELETIQEKYGTKKQTDDIDISLVQNMYNTLKSYQNQFDSLKNDWLKERDNRVLNKLSNALAFADYIFNYNDELVGFKSYDHNARQAQADSAMNATLQHAITIYTDTLLNKLLSKELYKSIKQSKSYLTTIKTELKVLQEKKKISSPDRYLNFFATQVTEQYKQLMALEMEALQHYDLVTAQLNLSKKKWKEMETDSKDLVKLKKERIEHVNENMEHAHNRDVELFKLMMKNLKSWKPYITNKLNS